MVNSRLCRYKGWFELGGMGVGITQETTSEVATCHTELAATQFSPGSINTVLAFEKMPQNKL